MSDRFAAWNPTPEAVQAMDAIRDAVTRVQTANYRKADEWLARLREEYRASLGRPPARTELPSVKDRTPGARWVRRQARDERARDDRTFRESFTVRVENPMLDRPLHLWGYGGYGFGASLLIEARPTIRPFVIPTGI